MHCPLFARPDELRGQTDQAQAPAALPGFGLPT
jgi:hypothetical protein